MKKALKIIGKVLWKLLIVGLIGFVVTFAIYMLNLENKLIYRFVYPLLQKAGVPYEEWDVEQHMTEATSLGLTQAPTLVVWGDTPQLYTGVSKIKEFLKQRAH